MNKLYNFYNELKRRNVIKAGISYCIVSWVLLQVVALISGILNAPGWLGQTLLITLLILLPVWLIISWYYEITPEGIKRTKNVAKEQSIAKRTSRQLNKIIIALLTVAVVLLIVDRFRIKSEGSAISNQIALNKQNENSIVVLPFQDLSPGGNQEYFADGLAEELLNSLSKIPELKVTSRTSAFSFKNQKTDIPTIAKRLGVNYILEGSVRTSDSLIRVTIQLIDTRKDKEVWSKIWDRKLKNIFEVQNSIAKAVSANMEISLMDTSLPKAEIVNPEAYALYLESKFWYRKNSNIDVNLPRAEGLIHQSIAIDSTYAPSWVLLAGIYKTQATYRVGKIIPAENFINAREAAKKAILVDPKEAKAYSLLALIDIEQNWKFAEAEPYIKKALELEPNNANVIEDAASIYLILGDEEEALAYNKQSVQLDPVNVNSQYNLAITYYYLGRFEEAIAPMRKSLALEQDQIGAHWILSLNYIKMNKFEEALIEIESEPDALLRQHTMAMLYWQQNDKKASEESLQKLITAEDHANDHIISQVYAFRGDNDNAFKWLERAYEKRIFELVEMKYDPFLTMLSDDPRWKPFLKKMNLP